MSLQIESRVRRSCVGIASLASMCVLCAGCARPQAVLNSWLDSPQDAQTGSADPGKLLKEESRNRVAANTGGTWPGWSTGGTKPAPANETAIADAEPTETGSVFAAFVRKREPAANQPGDPFLAEAQYQTDAEIAATNARPSAIPEPYDSTYRGLGMTQQPSPVGFGHRQGESPSPALQSGPPVGQLPEWGRHNVIKEYSPVAGLDSQYDRLRTAMNEDAQLAAASNAGSSNEQAAKSYVQRLMEQARYDLQQGRLGAAYQSVLEAETLAERHALQFEAHEQPPADLSQQIRREIESILQVQHAANQDGANSAATHAPEVEPHRDGQLQDDFPWAMAATKQDAMETALRETAPEFRPAPAESEPTAEVEFLPPPPVIPPDESFAGPQNEPLPDRHMVAENLSAGMGHPLADAADLPLAPWMTAQAPPQQGTGQGFRDAAAPSAPLDQERERGRRTLAMAAGNEQLAMIIPHGSSPRIGMPQPRVSANSAAVLQTTDATPMAAPRAIPAPPSRFERPARPPAIPEPPVPDVFEQTSPPELAPVATSPDLDWHDFETPPPAPAPPAEPRPAEPLPRALSAIEWVDDVEPVEDNKIAGLPLPMVFGISIAAAFGIGLAIRRKSKSEAA